MAIEQAEWNITIGTPCEFILLNPGPGDLQEGRDYVRIGRGSPGEHRDQLGKLHRMLDKILLPNGTTPITDRLNEIHQRISGEYMTLVEHGQRVVLVIATDGLPTGARSGSSTHADRQRMVQALTRLMLELSVFVVIRLTTDDDDVISFYNEVDEQLELPLEVLDDIESEAKEIRDHGNGWLTYSPLLHKIREGGTFVKLFDLLDERCLTPTEVSLFAQLLLRQEGIAPMPHSAHDFCTALEKSVNEAERVYDPLLRRMKAPINVNQARWVVIPPSARMSVFVRSFGMMMFNSCSQRRVPEIEIARTELVF